MLNKRELRAKISKNIGGVFHLLHQKERKYKIIEVDSSVIIERVQSHEKSSLSINIIERCYEYVKTHETYTRIDYNAYRLHEVNLPRIIALLPFVLPDEIKAFSQEEGKTIVGENLRGICTVERYKRHFP
ncbi:MAG: hypothetical protein GY861_01385 [bacterium]|nr:hypothetical protein [bacterium]